MNWFEDASCCNETNLKPSDNISLSVNQSFALLQGDVLRHFVDVGADKRLHGFRGEIA